jgi:peptide subunit release factor 1 (eRF1)
MSNNLALCPECHSDVRFKKPPVVGQSITCRRCKTQLVVVQKSPILLEWAEEAWDDFPGKESPSRKDNRRRRDDDW